MFVGYINGFQNMVGVGFESGFNNFVGSESGLNIKI